MTAQKRRSRVSSLLAITTTALVAVTGALAVPAVAQAAETPALTVSKSVNLDSAGEKVTVQGSGYNPDQSIYLTFCGDVPLEDVSFNFIAAGCTGGAVLVTKTPKSPTQVQFQEDGSFEAEITVSPRPGATAGTALYTIADHTGMSNRTQDAKAGLKFGAPVALTAPQVQASEGALKVSVGASNVQTLDADAGVYAALIVKGTEAELGMGSQGAAADFVVKSRIVDGAFSSTLTAPASKLDRTKQYEVLVWRAHGNATPDRIVARVDVPVTAEQWKTVFPTAFPYTDVKPTDTHYKGINWMFQKGYAAPAPKYYPANAMTRGAMSTMLQRIHEPNYTPSANLKLPFGDVKPGDTHYKGIAWMWENGYAAKAAKFNPANSVTRGAMATFMQRLEAPKYQPSQGLTLPYSDVKKGDTHYRGIAWMRESGNAAPAAKYYAANATTRGAMATFLMRIYS
ncbi:hypothetical protein D3248_02890 [Leucobacter zeae]|nr:hypothetical protein [Leucobacter zeae]